MTTPIETLTERLIAHKTGEFTSVLMHLGLRLGLVEALRDAGPTSAATLAERTGLHPRWVLEWLRQQTTAGLIEYVDEEHFRLPEGLGELLLDPDSTSYVGWIFQPPLIGAGVDRLAAAFRTGIGMTWDDHGEEGAHLVATSTAAQHRLLATHVIPLLDDAHTRLEEGAEAIDVGCGAGIAIAELAKAFPASRFLGVDPSPTAVARAEAHVKAEGLRNVELRVGTAEDIDGSERFDFAMVLDCMHDMTHPERTAQALHRLLKPEGTWLLKDVRCSETLRENLEHPMASMLYGVSIAFCMSSAMSTEDGAGLGTMGFHPQKARELVAEAGFGRIRTLEYEEDPMNLFYEVRP